MHVRPGPTEYSEFHAAYVNLVPGGEILATIEGQGREAARFLKSISEEKGSHRYAPGKWTIKEVIGHVIDTERIQAYRALRIARGDQTPLAGFEQDEYIPYSNSNQRAMADLVEEFSCVRRSSVLLFTSFDAAAWPRRGAVNNWQLTVRGIAYILIGHEINHRNALRDKYLAG